MNFVVLSSSSGTTFQAVLDRIADGSLTSTCLGLVTDRADRGCAEKAQAAGIPVKIVEMQKGEEREAYDRRLQEAISKLGQADVIAALGWMFIFSPWFVTEWKNKIINVHPALLPKHPGTHALEDTLAAGDEETGMTIHLIDEGVDTGPTILQKECPVEPGDTVQTLKDRVQALEKEWYPKVLQMIETGDLTLPQ